MAAFTCPRCGKTYSDGLENCLYCGKLTELVEEKKEFEFPVTLRNVLKRTWADFASRYFHSSYATKGDLHQWMSNCFLSYRLGEYPDLATEYLYENKHKILSPKDLEEQTRAALEYAKSNVTVSCDCPVCHATLRGDIRRTLTSYELKLAPHYKG